MADLLSTGKILYVTLHGSTKPVALAKSLRALVARQRRSAHLSQEVHLKVDPTFRMGVLMTEAGRNVMKLIGGLPHLKTVIVRGSFRAPFPVSALTRLFGAAKGIVRFSMFQMILVGSSADFVKFAESVGHQAESLEVFDIDMMFVLHRRYDLASESRSLPLDPLLKSLLMAKTLKVLLLGGCNVSSLEGCVTFSILEELFRSTTIRRLSVVNFPISFLQMCQVATILQANHCLQHLCLSCGAISPGEQATPPALLATRKGGVGITADLHEKAKESNALATMLRVNRSLERIVLYLPKLDQDEELTMELLQAVGDSATIKGVYLGSLERMSRRISQTLLLTLQKNFVLEEFGFVCASQGLPSDLYPCSGELFREITMFLRLNKDARRGKLVQNDNASREQWVGSLAKVTDSLDCIFHLLSLNPALLDSRKRLTAKNSSAKRSRVLTGEKTAVDHGSKRKRLYRAAKYAGVSYR